ncbi:hypothetical protein EIP86_001339 [Pleurotus ostreatoroseus]|nr:hypothetical protein EIP86_001339 [Pleurotus ostreatoroseus]
MASKPDIMETFKLGPFIVPRIFNGLWQLSSNAWGSASSYKIRQQMAEYSAQGFIAFGEYVLYSANPSADSDRTHCADMLITTEVPSYFL